MTLLPSAPQLLIGTAAVVIVLMVVAVGKAVIWWVTRD
jgi:hypothetical protein